MKRSDFESGQWSPEIPKIGAHKVQIDGFTFDYERITSMPQLFLMLLICMDPTEKQKEMLEKFQVVFTDDNGKQVFPKVDDNAEDKTDNKD